MKIGFFFQNNKQGGLDTFVRILLTDWPEPDKLTLFCNISHPGLDYLREVLPQKIEIIPYKFLIFQDLQHHLKNQPKIFVFIIKLMFWIFGTSYQVSLLKNFFPNHNLDRLLVINGGYPGGDACLSASIAWNKLAKNKKAWMNFHNFVVPENINILRRFRERLLDSVNV